MYSIAVMQLYILICQKYAALRRIFDPIRIDDTYRVSDQMYRDTYRIGSSKRYTTLVLSVCCCCCRHRSARWRAACCPARCSPSSRACPSVARAGHVTSRNTSGTPRATGSATFCRTTTTACVWRRAASTRPATSTRRTSTYVPGAWLAHPRSSDAMLAHPRRVT